MTMRSLEAHLDAANRRLYTDRRARWQETILLLRAWGSEVEDLPEYPDYADSEEEYDAEAVEAELMAHSMVRHVAAPPLEAPQPTE